MRWMTFALHTLLVATYPLLVYVGAGRFSARALGLAIALVVIAAAMLRYASVRNGRIRDVLRIPLVIVSFAFIGAIIDDHRVVMLLPVAVNAALFVQFAGSLRGVPLVERFALLEEESLSDAQRHYCRNVTLAWSAFFVGNGATALLLALYGTRGAWALYTGVIAYGLIGLMAGTEYVIRKMKFRKFASHPLDRALARLLGEHRSA
jgi:uncharacterized membrane protein